MAPCCVGSRRRRPLSRARTAPRAHRSSRFVRPVKETRRRRGAGFEPPVPLAKRVGLRRNGKCRRGEKGCLERVVHPAGTEGSNPASSAGESILTRTSGPKAPRFREPVNDDRYSRRPVRYANQLPRQIESLIVAAKRDKPHWGARKIRELLVRRLDDDISESLLVVNFAIGDRYWMADGAQNPCTPIHGNANSPGFG